MTNSLLDLNMDDAQEMKTLANDSEVEIQISTAEVVPNKSDPTRNNLALTFTVPSDITVDDIKLWLPIPPAALKEEDPKKYNKQLLRIKDFYEGFGVDTSRGVDPVDLIGLTAYAIIGESEDPNYGMQNFVRRYVKKR